MTKKEKLAVLNFYTSLSDRLSKAMEQAGDNVADKGLSVNVIKEFKSFLWEATKTYLEA